MSFSHLLRQWFLIISLWVSLTVVILVGSFISRGENPQEVTAMKNISYTHSTLQANTVKVAGVMIEASQISPTSPFLPKALFPHTKELVAEQLATEFSHNLPTQSIAITSPEHAALCRSRCEDVSLIFYLERSDGTRIKERHAKDGKLYAVRDELDSTGSCQKRYTLRFEDTVQSETQLADFDYNDVVLEVEQQGTQITVRPVYSEASDNVQLGVSLYSQEVFDRDIVIFESLATAMKEESQRPGEGTMRLSITPTLPDACNRCTFACQDIALTYHTTAGVRIEKESYPQAAACSMYERVSFIDDMTGATLGVIDARQVGTYVSFIPIVVTSSTLPVSIALEYRDNKQELFPLYQDLSLLDVSDQEKNIRIIDSSEEVPVLQCMTLETSTCTPRCNDVDFTLMLTDSLGNKLVEGSVFHNNPTTEREEIYWEDSCNHSYIIKFDDPLAQGEPFHDVWIRVERRRSSITITPIQYDSTRDYQLDLRASMSSVPDQIYHIAPSLHQWLTPGSAAESFTFTFNLLSSEVCPQGISWQ